MKRYSGYLFIYTLGSLLACSQAKAQSDPGVTTTGSNISSPSASVATSTTGGTNINYQTNNAYNNEYGFAPGIFCRTPTLFLGGGLGTVNSSTKDDPFNTQYENNASYNWQTNTNVNAQIGIVYPFGSSVIEDCKTLARQITIDRRISTELSLLRTCSSIEKEGLIIDPQKYPLLSVCIKNPANQQGVSGVQSKASSPAPVQTKMPITTRS